jgi:MIP family channel proteins
MFKSKVFVAEFIGTFALVFVCAAAGIYSSSIGLLGIALAYGLTVAVFVYAYGDISGGHVNPAVTFGLALQGSVKWVVAVVSYWLPQFLGAIAAVFLLKTFVTPLSPDAIASTAVVGALNATYPYHAMAVEVLLTFLLVNTFLHTVVSGRAGQFAGLAIGLTVVIAVMAGGPLTGASLNPARTFGPALFTGSWNNPMTYMIYFLGPLFGSTLAVVAYQFLNKEDEELMEEELEIDVEFDE